MIVLSERQLQDFQELLPWSTAMRLPDGRVLGNPGKRGVVSEDSDFRVDLLRERFGRGRISVLELGSHEGIHTVRLSNVAREVLALEVRPQNVVCSLARLFVHDVTNVRVVLGDVRDLRPDFGRFDVLFHVGVLYHLDNPVEHLHNIAPLAKTILLDTHYGTPGGRLARADVESRGVRYEAYHYPEAGWSDPFSGVASTSAWLGREALLEALRNTGFADIEIVDDRSERNGERLTLLARRDGA
jgi:SAM-dependent methyltransferase